MSWSIGVDRNWNRDIGYGVPAVCDHPDCNEKIDRGLSFVCGGEAYGGEHGCGLFLCGAHLLHGEPRDPDVDADGYDQEDAKAWAASVESSTGNYFCERCLAGAKPFEPKPDIDEWVRHKATDPSWAMWRTTRDGKRFVAANEQATTPSTTEEGER
jgi:hypothetical protein